MKPLRQIVDAHSQLYRLSCSPSLIELLLKAHGLVSQDFYELQNQYQNENVGLTCFGNRKMQGLYIHCHDESKGQSFLDRLQELLKEGHTVALYCVNPDGHGCHGWLVDGVRGGRLYLLSKGSELGNGEGHQTVESTLQVNSGKSDRRITDLIYGTIQDE